jgi:hypothetical protein
MAIVEDLTKGMKIQSDSYEANEDLSSSQWCVVAPVAGATGKMKVGLPSGQGVLFVGVLQNDPESGEQANVRQLGTTKVKANAAFNSGIELAISGTDGKVAAAASGDYVCGISREAAKGANHLISMYMTQPYQKN